MKIVLTGSTGFFGSFLYNFLQKELPNAEIFTLSRRPHPEWNYTICDIKCETSVKDYLNYVEPDVIIHLAANPRGNADLSAMDDNVKGTHHLVHYAPEGCHFIFASSIVVYGAYNHFNFLEDMTPKPISLYGVSKLNAENIINRYALLGKIKKINYRYCALVGPNLTHGFIYDLTNKILGITPKLELIGEKPGSIKPFLHVEDAARSILFAILNKLTGTYNVCPSDNVSVEKVAKTAMEILKVTKPIVWRPDQVWVGDNNEIKGGNCKLFSKGFDFKYKTSLEALRQYFYEYSN